MIHPGKMLRLVLASVFRKPATEQYPFTRPHMPERFRGKILFDPANCIGCKLCERDCPTDAIRIRKVGEKRFEADIDCSRCIYCAQCVDSCPKKALASSGEFELAQIHPEALKVVYRNTLPPAPPAPPKTAAAAPVPATSTAASATTATATAAPPAKSPAAPSAEAGGDEEPGRDS